MKRNPSRLIPGFVAAVLVLSACGSDDDTAGDTAGETVPAGDSDSSAASASSTDQGLVAPRPIQVSSAAGGDAASVAAEDAQAGRVADSSFAAYQITNFELGPDLPPLPDNQFGYVFDKEAASIDVDQVNALAAALGVAGEAVRKEDGYGSAWWIVGPDDGTAPSLTVYEDAQLSWYYSPEWASTGSTSVGCAVEGSAGAGDAAAPAVEPAVDAPLCEVPKPEGILTAEQAEARTRQLMIDVGLDPAGYVIEPYADEWYASATAQEQLEGGFTGRRFDAGFGADGELQSAGGQLAAPAKAGPYDLIDLDTAIARLGDQSGFWGGRGGGIQIDIAEAPVSDAMPVDSVPIEPQQVTVTLVDVQPDLWWVWDADGTVWLLPAYRFIGDDGGWYTVPAVSDDLLVVQAPPETTAVEPLPVEPEPDSTVAPAGTPAELEALVGLPLTDFTEQAEALGFTARVVYDDETGPLAVTQDYSESRVNVHTRDEGGVETVYLISHLG
jgi:hypothetical protein